jgi:hypothetical protein
LAGKHYQAKLDNEQNVAVTLKLAVLHIHFWYKTLWRDILMLSVKAVYKDDKIELMEKPANIKQAQVIVTFLENPELSLTQYDLSAVIGKLRWQGDAIAEQRRLPDEW